MLALQKLYSFSDLVAGPATYQGEAMDSSRYNQMARGVKLKLLLVQILQFFLSQNLKAVTFHGSACSFLQKSCLQKHTHALFIPFRIIFLNISITHNIHIFTDFKEHIFFFKPQTNKRASVQ